MTFDRARVERAQEAAGLTPGLLAYSVKDTAKWTGAAYHSLLRAIEAGELRCKRPNGGGRRWLIEPEWAVEWMERGEDE